MIERHDILSLGFLALSPFTGSDKDLRYRIEKISRDDNDHLLASAWIGPFSFDNTPEDQIKTKEADFSDEGIVQLVNWLNEREGL